MLFQKTIFGDFTYVNVYKHKNNTSNNLHGMGECEVQCDTKKNIEKHLDLVECRHELQAVKHKLPLNLLPLLS